MHSRGTNSQTNRSFLSNGDFSEGFILKDHNSDSSDWISFNEDNWLSIKTMLKTKVIHSLVVIDDKNVQYCLDYEDMKIILDHIITQILNNFESDSSFNEKFEFLDKSIYELRHYFFNKNDVDFEI